jgi:geranylgeranyl diphosphate synthase type II
MPLSPEQIEEALRCALSLPDKDIAPERARLLLAIRGAVSNGGKRLRFRLLLEAAHVASTHAGRPLDIAAALPAACAIELIHAYSLVHDDLPAMDDADTRRGRPSCHKEFGEATAILVGDALLTLAFEIMAQAPPERSTPALRATAILARAAGEAGMVGGQMIDIAWSNAAERDGTLPHINGEELLAMHALKTGALIRAACEMGGVLGGGEEATIRALSDYGAELGRAFQLKDDLLDIEGDPAKTGKSATDVANDKITAPAFFGLEATRVLAQQASAAAVAALELFNEEADTLRELARFAVERER